ncbi:hypothetical protein WDU94_006007 [Cyamophila willieti]
MKVQPIFIAAALFLTTHSQRIPQSYFPLRQESNTTSQSLPSSYLPAPPNYELPKPNATWLGSHQQGYTPGNQLAALQQGPLPQSLYQPIPYSPDQIPAFNPVQSLNQIGRVDQIPAYDQPNGNNRNLQNTYGDNRPQPNPYGDTRPPDFAQPNYTPANQASVPVVNDPTVVQIAQYSNPQIPDVFRNSLLNVPQINQLNYNLVAPNAQGSPTQPGQSPTLGYP